MKIAIVAEADPTEPRVAATPDTVKKIMALGAEVAVEPGAGQKSGVLDADYAAAGATHLVFRFRQESLDHLIEQMEELARICPEATA